MTQILKSIFGRQLGLTADERLMAIKGFLSGADGSQFAHAAPDRVVLLDDFIGKTLSGVWGVAKGSDGGAANFAISAALDGRAVGTTGAGAGATMAVNGIRLDSALNWAGAQGGLDMQARLKMDSIATFAIFVGFSNQAGALSMPANGSGSGNGITTGDNDCFGFLYDTTMTTKDWWLVGSAATVDATMQDSGVAPVAATDVVLRCQYSKTSGQASFFINGTQVGLPMAAPVTAATPLTPCIAAFTRAAVGVNVSVDYVQASQAR